MRSPSYKVDHIGRHVRSSKLRHAWTLHLAGEPRETTVELQHSKFTGKKKVLLDGKVVFTTKDRCLRWCWEHAPSQTRVSLRSENGTHDLTCESPGQELQAGTGAALGSPHRQDCDRERSAGTSRARTGGSRGRRSITRSGHRRGRRSCSREGAGADAEELAAGAGGGEAAVARAAENARLQSLIDAREAQIAVLQGQLRQCGCETEGCPEQLEAFAPAPPALEQPGRRVQQAVLPEATPAPVIFPAPVATAPASPRRPSGQLAVASSPAAASSVASAPTALVCQEAHQAQLAPLWDPLEGEELDVTRRHGPWISPVQRAPEAITQQAQQPESARIAQAVAVARTLAPLAATRELVAVPVETVASPRAVACAHRPVASNSCAGKPGCSPVSAHRGGSGSVPPGERMARIVSVPERLVLVSHGSPPSVQQGMARRATTPRPPHLQGWAPGAPQRSPTPVRRSLTPAPAGARLSSREPLRLTPASPAWSWRPLQAHPGQLWQGGACRSSLPHGHSVGVALGIAPPGQQLGGCLGGPPGAAPLPLSLPLPPQPGAVLLGPGPGPPGQLAPGMAAPPCGGPHCGQPGLHPGRLLAPGLLSSGLPMWPPHAGFPGCAPAHAGCVSGAGAHL